jgi:hypothetical protein
MYDDDAFLFLTLDEGEHLQAADGVGITDCAINITLTRTLRQTLPLLH